MTYGRRVLGNYIGGRYGAIIRIKKDWRPPRFSPTEQCACKIPCLLSTVLNLNLTVSGIRHFPGFKSITLLSFTSGSVDFLDVVLFWLQIKESEEHLNWMDLVHIRGLQ